MILDATLINPIGTACFGAVIGWCIYYSLRRWKTYSPTQIGVLITAVLGGAVTTFFAGPYNTSATGAYGIGLAIGFFSYFIFAFLYDNLIDKDKNKAKGGKHKQPEEVLFMEDSNSQEQGDRKEKPVSPSDFFTKDS